MASSLDLAGSLRGLDPSILEARLGERHLARPTTVHDAFDLADALLEPSSVREALTRLDRTALLVLQASRTPRPPSDLLSDVDPQFEVSVDQVDAAASRLASLFLVVVQPDGRVASLDPVSIVLDENPDLTVEALAGTRPPVVLESVDDLDPATLDARSAERLYAIVIELAEVLRAVAVAPARELAKGGLALPETRRLSEAARVDVADVAPLIGAARSAGLVELGPDGWIPTAEAEGWLQSEWSSRWASLVGAWLGSLPREILLVLDQRVDTSWGAPLRTFSEWLFPAGGQWIPERLDAFARSAELFGLTSGGRPTSVAVALLREGVSAARSLVGALMPQPIDQVYLQHDLTVVAPGPLAPSLDGRLRTIAEVESAGLAATYRISEAGIQQALSSGETEASLREFLESISSTGIPQPLGYLLTETAARHGRFRVASVVPGSDSAGLSEAARTFGAVSQVRSDDPSLVDALEADQALAPLGLRRDGDHRLLCRYDAETLYWALTDERYPVVLEDAAAAPLRSPIRRKVRRSTVAPPGNPIHDLVARLSSSAGDSAEDTERAWIIRQLDAAVKARITVQLTVAQSDGSTSTLSMEPTGVGGGRVRGRDRKSDIERTLPLSSIVAVAGPEA
ncbi:helicase-associated domain-containing protein [Frondihabitans cladoniiphilus]|uniref:Helicase XPB/Ssl2 N-terminal domain-containing protein n=1 Tax=Frondihabitans cladoniiphilus TaxID=715785 RepID=A0ABP8VX62_9MICO